MKMKKVWHHYLKWEDYQNGMYRTVGGDEKKALYLKAIEFTGNPELYGVRAVPIEKIRANSYNPNAVAPPEMELLETSIWEDGYTMPVVCYYKADEDIYEIVDGFHRYTVLKTSKRIFDREKGLLPVVVIDKDESNRMASTIRHNRACTW